MEVSSCWRLHLLFFVNQFKSFSVEGFRGGAQAPGGIFAKDL